MTKAVHKQLPNLDSVRALAALMVVVSHIELQKQELDFSNIRPVIKNFGSIGVTIFFVLSGFLITYLLFEEHSSRGRIHITRFYFRRMLRIWPLYFIVLFFGIFVYPAHVDTTGIVLSVFFLSNIAFMLEKLPSLIDPIWSLGVEEQFYLFHPHIFRMGSLKKIFNSLIVIFISLYVLKFCASRFNWEICSKVMYKARFDCMMLGGIFSMWIINHQRDNRHFKTLLSPDFIFSKKVQAGLYATYVSYLILSTVNQSIYNEQLLSLLTAGAIGNLALNPNCIINIQNRFLSFVGKISFGLYLLHKLPIQLMLLTSRALGINNLALQNLFVYSTSIPLALLLAYLSFRYYESYFLKLKDKKLSANIAAPPRMKIETA